MDDSFYDTAQVCLNGHLITCNYHLHPVHRQQCCQTCGESTTIRCTNCAAEIRGSYEVPGVAWMGAPSPPPNFCHNCGESYPWTKRRLEAAKELAEEFDNLDETEINKLKGALDDLVRETPKSEAAGLRFKKLMAKAGKESFGAMKKVLVDVVSETVKKSIFGG
ncbi:MAG: DUF2321 domain-containing protein [Verrucomicrobiota bacterium]|nr:DUF2321 domain-containing protein [Verrucomicrobiota bacterium]